MPHTLTDLTARLEAAQWRLPAVVFEIEQGAIDERRLLLLREWILAQRIDAWVPIGIHEARRLGGSGICFHPRTSRYGCFSVVTWELLPEGAWADARAKAAS